MVAEWVNVPAVWCDPWSGHILEVGSNPTRGMAGLHTLVEPLLYRFNQLYGCQSNNTNKKTSIMTHFNHFSHLPAYNGA